MKSVFRTKGFIAFIAVFLVMAIAFGASFGLRKSIKKQEAETTTQPTTQPAPVKSWYELYEECLTETISSNPEISGAASFGLFFLDDDDTPELFVIPAKTNGAGPTVYTVRDNELKELGSIGGCYGGFGYVEKGGKIVSSNARQNSYGIMVYTLENDELVPEWLGSANYIFEEDADEADNADEYEAHDWDYEDPAIFANFQSQTGDAINLYDETTTEEIADTAEETTEEATDIPEETTDAGTADALATETVTYDQFMADYQTYVPEKYISKDMSMLGFGGTVNGYCLEYPLEEDVITKFFEIVVDNDAETLASGTVISVTGTVTDYYGSYADGESTSQYSIVPDTPYIVYISGDSNFPEGRLVCISEFVLHNHEGSEYTSGKKVTATGTLKTSIPYGSFANTEFILDDAVTEEAGAADESSALTDDTSDTSAEDGEMTVAEDVTEILY